MSYYSLDYHYDYYDFTPPPSRTAPQEKFIFHGHAYLQLLKELQLEVGHIFFTFFHLGNAFLEQITLTHFECFMGLEIERG